MTTPDLPTLYARVAAVCPEIAGQVKRAKRNEVWDASHWECGFSGRFIPDALAESLIIAACVRVLGLDGDAYGWIQLTENSFRVWRLKDGDTSGQGWYASTLASALLLAVEARAGKEKGWTG